MMKTDSGYEFGWVIRCDDPNRKIDAETDMWFAMADYDKMQKQVADMEKRNLKFDLVFQKYYTDDTNIEEITIIGNNIN